MREPGKPEALWFGRDQARCFGMLREPEAASNRGVVFCNALAFEGSIARRAFFHVARNLTARGFWTLQFDYDGEGDSAGGAWEPRRLDAWIASIDAAVGLMRARGVTDVRLVGFRVGASLAWLYATTHPHVSSVALWAPCVRGSAYVREQRALSRLSAAARPAQRVPAGRFPADSLEVVGYELAAETLKDLSELDLLTETGPFAPPDVLVIDREDAPANDDLVSRMVASGSRVTHHRLVGYADFVTEGEDTSVLPWPILGCLEEWLEHASSPDVTPIADGSAGGAVESATLPIDDPTAGRFTAPDAPRDCVTEEAVWVAGRFFSICSRPAGRAPIRAASIVLCSVGSTARIGPGRLYVGLARYWASLGFTVLRIDLGGVGDSLDADPATENQPRSPVRINELQDALTWVRQWTGNESIVAAGVCSGGFNAFQVAVKGFAIDHLLIVNPGTFYRGGDEESFASEEAGVDSVHKLTRGLLNTRMWKLALQDPEVMRRGFKLVRSQFQAKPIAGLRLVLVAKVRNAAHRVGLPVQSSSALARDLDGMIKRGVKLLIVFAANESSARYLRTVGGPECAALEDGGGLDVVNIDGGDHIFSSPGARQQLVDELTSYLEREYPSPVEILAPDGASDV